MLAAIFVTGIFVTGTLPTIAHIDYGQYLKKTLSD